MAIHYRDLNKNYGAIGTFTSYNELNSILKKVVTRSDFVTFSDTVCNRGLYRFSEKIYSDYPTEMTRFSDPRISSAAFERLPELFFENKPDDENEYIQIYGLLNGKRVYRWFNKEYFNIVDSFDKYKVFVPTANGSGALGEVLSTPLIGEPLIGHTETFLTVGCFDNLSEAQACLKYVKSKFARCMLGVLKITQNNSPEKWAYVPLQDFTENSDIDWSQSVANIDTQLFAKYHLSPPEISFIQTHVKEMI